MAGSLVRMTGSGMGCPDWPKCFGYLIPPTQESQVMWSAENQYKQGQFIVHNNVLYYANSSFISDGVFNKANWQEYEKHDYATFNAKHTWIEYLNRLAGALSGLFVLVQFIWAILVASKRSWKKFLPVVILAFLQLPLMGFQAWLGKVVVDSNLAVYKITAHMFGALLIVAVQLAILSYFYPQKNDFSRSTKALTWISLILVLIQTYLGTQVRESVDIVNKAMDGLDRSTWISQLDGSYIIHRSFAWLLIVAIAYLIYKKRKEKSADKFDKFVLFFTGLSLVVALVMVFASMPAIAQPLHLLAAVGLFSTLIWQLLQSRIN